VPDLQVLNPEFKPHYHQKKKEKIKSGVGVCTYNPSIWEAEVGGTKV
jgi:hypothetical protein